MRNNNKNLQQAKLAAQRLYKKVNFDGGNLQTYQLSSLMQQTYDFLKSPYKPTTNDIKEYGKVLDANGDGSVSLQDLETMAINYLCGQGVLGQNYSKKSIELSQSQQRSSHNIASNDYSNYGSNYSSNPNSSKNIQSQSKSYQNYTSKTSQYNNNLQSYTNSANNYQQNSSYSQNVYEQASSSATRTQQYQGHVSITDNVTTTTKYMTQQQQQPSRSIPQQSQQSKQHQVSSPPALSQQPRSKYTSTAQNYLSITRNLFKKYSNQSSNTITRDKVAVLLTQTYGALGRKGYYPSEEDVNVWMKLCDTNTDGHVEQSEYQYFVVRALERSGIQVNA